MGGMKEGATDNPFQTDEPTEEEQPPEESADDEPESTPDSDTTTVSTETTTDSDTTEHRNADGNSEDGTNVSSPDTSEESEFSVDTGAATVELRKQPSVLAEAFTPDTYDLPHAWALGRSSVKDGRQEEKTFHLQSSVVELEEEAMNEVGELLDDQVKMTDLREAALIVAYSNPELVADLLTEWGAEHA